MVFEAELTTDLMIAGLDPEKLAEIADEILDAITEIAIKHNASVGGGVSLKPYTEECDGQKDGQQSGERSV